MENDLINSFVNINMMELSDKENNEEDITASKETNNNFNLTEQPIEEILSEKALKVFRDLSHLMKR